ncbi:MAG: hypothetical protein CYPHOPRED_005780 [Cyphobasidiales sp. Tagirdzhanova-0007]|nr:MAG: hypothetical protein CYPHOPRED_005780 [Cyphobasidiales sp. Tagirdzhanova-0007]
MPGRLAHRVAIITGGGSGIGLETSILFASEGAHVVVADINEAAAQKTVKLVSEVVKDAPKAIAVVCDVGNEKNIESLVNTTVKTFGRLDVIFNNAGIMHPKDDDVITTEEKIWDLTQQINVKGVWWGCKYAILAMRNNPNNEQKGLNKGGSIINTASFVASMGAATPQLAYTASKGAVLAMTREMAMVHAREGIRVNALSPGPLRTPLLMEFLNTPEKRRFGEAIEQAKAALFLASDDSSYITGSDFKVDGGLSSCYVTPEGEPARQAPQGFSGL